MRIMFAASDRDLLRCCSELLEQEGYTVDTAFDGVQVLTKLSRGGCDLLILSSDIQRVEPGRIIENCRRDGVPTLELLSSPLTLKTLIAKAPANAYLELPFSPKELVYSVADLAAKLASDAELKLGELAVKTSAFEINGIPLTSGEMDMLARLGYGERGTEGRKSVLAASLNCKFERLRIKNRIEYRRDEGYRMVTGDE